MKIYSNKTYVDHSKIADGYGVFAINNIKKGEIIEIAPAIFLPISEMKHIKQTKLNYYYFEFTRKEIMVALGYGSLYNHSYTPNARYYLDYTNRVLRIQAFTDIQQDEEITFNYNYFPRSQNSLGEWYKTGIDKLG